MVPLMDSEVGEGVKSLGREMRVVSKIGLEILLERVFAINPKY